MSLTLVGVVFFFVFGILFTIVELLRPARPIRYRAVIRNDLVALAIYQLLFVPLAVLFASRLVKPHHFFLTDLLSLPLPVRVVLYYVLADIGSYWLHRLMHSTPLWRAHRWHHSPSYMYWLAGIRATAPQQFLFNLPFAFCAPLLHHAPVWVLVLVVAEAFVRNNWMHMNVAWPSRWLEWVFVTPRYHHIHHSNHPAHYTANLGSLLTIWDRLFGTYVDPDTVEELSFGVERSGSPIRLVLGV